jgi:hypothetical protein
MIIVIIDESLEVADLDLFLAALALHQGVQLQVHAIGVVHGPINPDTIRPVSLWVEVARVALEQFLDDLVVLKLIMGYAQDLEGLLAGHESALDAQALLGHLLATLVAEFLHCWLVAFFVQVLEYLYHAVFFGEGPNHSGFLDFPALQLRGPLFSRRVDLCRVLPMRVEWIHLILCGMSSPWWILTADFLHARIHRGVSRYHVGRMLAYTSTGGAYLGMAE